jgi:hypothetical protein
MLDLDSQHPVEFPEISDLYMLSEAILEGVHEVSSAGSNCAVIDMNSYNCYFMDFQV